MIDMKEACDKIYKLSKGNPEEIDKRLAVFIVDEKLQEFQKAIIPSKPQALISYQGLSPNQRFKFEKENPDWRQSPEIAKYFKDISAAESHNESHLWWLNHWMKIVKDEERKRKYALKIGEFPVKPKVHFNKPITKESQTKQDIINKFWEKK